MRISHHFYSFLWCFHKRLCIWNAHEFLLQHKNTGSTDHLLVSQNRSTRHRRKLSGSEIQKSIQNFGLLTLFLNFLLGYSFQNSINSIATFLSLNKHHLLYSDMQNNSTPKWFLILFSAFMVYIHVVLLIFFALI